MEKKGGTYSEDRQKLVAYHEAGHAILGAVMEEYDLVNKISIVPRGGAGGVTIFTPDEEVMESGMYSKSYLLNRICVGMGGRIAEEIINGKSKVTTGASNDFQQVTNTAKMMVEQMGMSDVIGPRNVMGDPNMSPMARAMGGGNEQGPRLQQNIDDEVDKILQDQYDRGMQIMTENKDVLDAIAKSLIEKEKIDGGQLLTIIEKLRPELVPAGAKEKVAEMIQRGGTGTTKTPPAELAPAV
jgi:cell division protease FtsH